MQEAVLERTLETYRAKLKNLDLECAKLGKELNKLLDEQSKLDKEIDKKLAEIDALVLDRMVANGCRNGMTYSRPCSAGHVAATRNAR